MAKVTGEGSIIQMEKDKPKSKCRKWQLRVPIGLNPRTGKYQQKTRVVEGTFTKAKADLREFIKEIEHDEVQGRTSYTFEEYCMRYLEIRAAKKEVAPTTQVRQEWQFRAAIRHIGKVNLAAVTPTMLDDMYIAMLKGDTLSGRPSSGSYVNQIHDNITLVFEHAIKEGILVKNPCDAANPPKMDTREKRAMKPEQIQELIEGLDPEVPRECAYLVAITMGLRRGEVCGLSWKDIDFENGIVDVSHSFDGLGNLKETKTKAGMRLLPLPEVTREALLRQKAAQAAQFAKTNQWRKPEEGYLEQTEDTPVIATHYGERVTPGSLSRWWSIDRERFGLDGWSFHELRHSYLTLLALNGVHPKVMQELAGHYSSQITMDIYTHVNLDAKKEAVAAVSKVF